MGLMDTITAGTNAASIYGTAIKLASDLLEIAKKAAPHIEKIVEKEFTLFENRLQNYIEEEAKRKADKALEDNNKQQQKDEEKANTKKNEAISEQTVTTGKVGGRKTRQKRRKINTRKINTRKRFNLR